MLLRVAAGTTEPRYNCQPPFHPDQHYPELPFSEISDTANPPYALLRHLLQQLGNPLNSFVRPGQTVVIKPNFVLSFNSSGQDVFAVVTHPSIIRALVDYVYIALRGNGRIVIADAPQMDCCWEELMRAQRLDSIIEFYQRKFQFNIEVYDLRNFELIDNRRTAFSDNRRPLPGDPQGSVIINLGQQSEFYGRASQNYYGADFNRQETIGHHHGETHEYSVSKTILSADVFLSVPKMKVHKKVGVTLNLKGLVGINTNKNFLVHHTIGQPSEGGDQLPAHVHGPDRFVLRAQRWFFDKALARQSRWGDLAYKIAAAGYKALIKPFCPISEEAIVLDAGNWYGNDSAWRMTADLAKILYFADSNGRFRETQQRQIFCVVDGIIGGENCGPLAPDAKPCGCLIAGDNPFAVDMVTAQLMGFDVQKIRQFNVAADGRWNFGITSVTDIEMLGDVQPFHFKPHPGWIGHIEA